MPVLRPRDPREPGLRVGHLQQGGLRQEHLSRLVSAMPVTARQGCLSNLGTGAKQDAALTAAVVCHKLRCSGAEATALGDKEACVPVCCRCVEEYVTRRLRTQHTNSKAIEKSKVGFGWSWQLAA